MNACNLSQIFTTKFLLACGMLLFESGCESDQAAKPAQQAKPKAQAARPVATAPEEVTPEGAKKMLDSPDGWVYLDVRTQVEFHEGHVPGAWNIPVMLAAADGSGMVANDNFLSVVEANLDKKSAIVVGCRSGRRSARARAIMQQAGYQAVTNMVGGWMAGEDSTGAPVPGWSKCGYPIAHGDGGEKSYATLASEVDP